MPSTPDEVSVLPDQIFSLSELALREIILAFQLDLRLDPELRAAASFFNMHVEWLPRIALIREKEQPEPVGRR